MAIGVDGEIMMTSRPAAALAYRLSQLDALEAESIHVFREVVAERERPVLLFSGSEDSIVMLRLAEKAYVRHDDQRGRQRGRQSVPEPTTRRLAARLRASAFRWPLSNLANPSSAERPAPRSEPPIA